jgi:Flp pilus assembly protein TadG
MNRRRFVTPGQKGQALVEMAIITTLLLTLVITAIDLGRVYFAYTGIRGAAERGAIAASSLSADWTAINNMVTNEAGGLVSIAAIDITCPDQGTSGATCRVKGEPVRVTVRSSFQPLVPYADLLWGSALTIEAAAEAVVL